jgi:hypothetical protein
MNSHSLLGIRLDRRVKILIVAVATLSFVLLNLRILLSAYAPTLTAGGVIPGNNYSVDFGSYYTAAWRLVHNPTQIYTHGLIAGDYPLGTNLITTYKYLPFFSFFMLPLLAFSFTGAFVSWDVIQFALLPVIGLLLYKSFKNVNILIIIAVMAIVLLQPLPFPPEFKLTLRQIYFSQSYYWQWAEGQAKVFLTFLIVAAFYLSKSRRPLLAGIFYGLVFFDLRFGLLTLPLVIIVNRRQYRSFLVATLATLAVGDAILLYDGLGSAFLNAVNGEGINTSYFPYTWITFYSIASLTVVEASILLWRWWQNRNILGTKPAVTAAQNRPSSVRDDRTSMN